MCPSKSTLGFDIVLHNASTDGARRDLRGKKKGQIEEMCYHGGMSAIDKGNSLPFGDLVAVAQEVFSSL